MPGFYASVVGGTVLLLLVLVGVWLTWLSLREDTHTPVPLRPDGSD